MSDHEAIVAVHCVLVDPADSGQDDSATAGHGFKARAPERLVVREVDEHICFPQQVGNAFARQYAPVLETRVKA